MTDPEYWNSAVQKASASRRITVIKQPFTHPAADYALLQFAANDGRALAARCITPPAQAARPLLLLFHDYHVPVRGWHHMTRFIAAGFSVVAMQNQRETADLTLGYQTAPEGMPLAQLYADALVTAHAAIRRLNPSCVVTWGEGLGGGLALVVASLLAEKVSACAMLNPMPAALEGIVRNGSASDFYKGIQRHFRFCDPLHANEQELLSAMHWIDLLSFAPLVRCRVLMGTALLDPLSPPDAQQKLFDALTCPKQRLIYAKHAHERINDFEDELLVFLRSCLC